MWAISVVFKTTAPSKQSPIGRNFDKSGHPDAHVLPALTWTEYTCTRTRTYVHTYTFAEKKQKCRQQFGRSSVLLGRCWSLRSSRWWQTSLCSRWTRVLTTGNAASASHEYVDERQGAG
jgi:hypothetical protein